VIAPPRAPKAAPGLAGPWYRCLPATWPLGVYCPLRCAQTTVEVQVQLGAEVCSTRPAGSNQKRQAGGLLMNLSPMACWSGKRQKRIAEGWCWWCHLQRLSHVTACPVAFMRVGCPLVYTVVCVKTAVLSSHSGRYLRQPSSTVAATAAGWASGQPRPQWHSASLGHKQKATQSGSQQRQRQQQQAVQCPRPHWHSACTHLSAS
jgi:hypothetical protein